MVTRRKISEMVIVEASTLATPLALERHSAFDGVRWLDGEVRKWLPRASVVVLFPRVHTLSPWTRELRNRLDLLGLRTSTRGAASDAEPVRTRQLWHVRSEGRDRPVGHYEYDLEADRVKEFIVPLGDLPQWEIVAAAVVEYAAVMAFPVGTYDDEEPF